MPQASLSTVAVATPGVQHARTCLAHQLRRFEISDAEWRTRVELAAAYRLEAVFEWDDLIYTHISARVPGTEGQFLINPYGLTRFVMKLSQPRLGPKKGASCVRAS